MFDTIAMVASMSTLKEATPTEYTITVRVPAETIARLDKWRKSLPVIPSRTKAALAVLTTGVKLAEEGR